MLLRAEEQVERTARTSKARCFAAHEADVVQAVVRRSRCRHRVGFAAREDSGGCKQERSKLRSTWKSCYNAGPELLTARRSRKEEGRLRSRLASRATACASTASALRVLGLRLHARNSDAIRHSSLLRLLPPAVPSSALRCRTSRRSCRNGRPPAPPYPHSPRYHGQVGSHHVLGLWRGCAISLRRMPGRNRGLLLEGSSAPRECFLSIKSSGREGVADLSCVLQVWPEHKAVCGEGKAKPFLLPDLTDHDLGLFARYWDQPAFYERRHEHLGHLMESLFKLPAESVGAVSQS